MTPLGFLWSVLLNILVPSQVKQYLSLFPSHIPFTIRGHYRPRFIKVVMIRGLN